MTRGGALAALTGKQTGRSPRDRFIVEESSTAGDIWWGEINQPISEERFDRLHARLKAYLQNREVFVQDLHARADPVHRLRVRLIKELAWHNLLARTMYIEPQHKAQHTIEQQCS